VSRNTVEQDFALNRQLFLCEQGYEYCIVTLDRVDQLLPDTNVRDCLAPALAAL
jgi:hypothetical protein